MKVRAGIQTQALDHYTDAEFLVISAIWNESPSQKIQEIVKGKGIDNLDGSHKT